MEVRRAAAGDADVITDVFIPSLESLEYLPQLHTHAEHRAFIRDVVLGEQEVWIAVEDGRVLGFAALAADQLMQIYVHPDAQRRGVGSALLDKAKERRPGGFSLWVFQQNEGARHFYERHGLTAVRFTDGSGNEERTPDALYEWQP